MHAVFVLASLIVGLSCGAALGYETRDLRNQPTGWRPWLVFAASAAVVIGCMAVVGHINESDPPTSTIKWASVLAGAAAFIAALMLMRKRR